MANLYAFGRMSHLYLLGFLAAQVCAYLIFAFGGVPYPQIGALLIPTLLINCILVGDAYASRNSLHRVGE